jgi:hypothetical protein
MTDIKNLHSKIKPLDVIAYQGGRNTIKSLYKIFSRIGIIVNNDIIPDIGLLDKVLYVWTSYTVISKENELKYGILISRLDEEIKSYKIAWCKLIYNPWEDNRKLIIDTFDRIHKKYFSYEITCCLREKIVSIKSKNMITNLDLNDTSDFKFNNDILILFFNRLGYKIEEIFLNPLFLKI